MLTGMWAVAGVAGVLVVAMGWLPGPAARDIALTRGGPVLGFLAAITVLAELADRAGVFDAAAVWCARAAGGSTVRLFLLIAALGTTTTIAMSLDTTAVLLTPVMLTLTTRLGLRSLPFALLAVWLANTASLLLPVSNLTNLLALQRWGPRSSRSLSPSPTWGCCFAATWPAAMKSPNPHVRGTDGPSASVQAPVWRWRPASCLGRRPGLPRYRAQPQQRWCSPCGHPISWRGRSYRGGCWY
jgi:hypothetical protein